MQEHAADDQRGHDDDGEHDDERLLGFLLRDRARAVIELAGIKDIKTKSYGSNNAINAVKATIAGLSQVRTAEQVAKLRGISVEQMR